MAISPEQFLQGLHQRGIRIDLLTEEPEPRFRLTAPEGRITERIREYIRRNRMAIFAMFGQSRCSECWCPVDEYDESAWRMSDDGDMYCIPCWQEFTKPASEPWQMEASAFLEQVLDERDISLFGPFATSQVMHIPTGRTWEPERQEMPANQSTVVDLAPKQQKPHRVA